MNPADPVRELVREQVLGGDMPGAVWCVEQWGGVLSSGAEGDACVLPSREPAAEDTPYDLASLTKPLVTCLLATILERRGELDLEAPVGEILPELRGSPYERVTLVDLGAHRGGLAPWRPLYLAASGLEECLRRIAAEPPAAPLGRTLYSDLGFILLGAAVERASGRTLDRSFDHLVAGPLGLRHTAFAKSGGRFARAAATETGNAYERSLAGREGAGHPFRESVLRGEVHDANAHCLGGVAGHSGLFGTAAEVSAIAREMLRPRGLDLDHRALRRLLEPAVPDGTRTFGFVTARGSDAARGALPDAAPGHTGFTGTSVWLDPPRGRVYVLLTNRVHPVVPERDFQHVRNRFHGVAAGLTAA